MNLLDDLQDDLGLSYIFVAHDLSVVRHVSDRIAVMYLGKIVELSSADTLYAQPKHPYTASLLEAIPIPDPERVRRAPHRAGRAAEPDQPAAGLPLPHPLPLRHRHLPHGRAAAGPVPRRAPGRVPPPAQRHARRAGGRGPVRGEPARVRSRAHAQPGHRRGRPEHGRMPRASEDQSVGFVGVTVDRRLLLVHAHPDDESINNAATMARYAAEGVEVTLVTCTLGELGEVLDPAVRRAGRRSGRSARRVPDQRAGERDAHARRDRSPLPRRRRPLARQRDDGHARQRRPAGVLALRGQTRPPSTRR